MSESTHPNIFPTLRYRDANAAIEWLGTAFGFQQHAVHRGDDGAVHHAELRLGAGMIMLGETHGVDRSEGSSSQGIYIVVDDPDSHHDRARAAGAEIVRGLVDQPYGSREYGALDIEGNSWSFGTYDPYLSV